MYNKKSFDKSLKKRFQEKIEEAKQKDSHPKYLDKPLEPESVDDSFIQETLSYEMMMQLAIYHHQKAKEAA